MLHIVRKKGEAITIDGGIVIRIVDLEGGHVRIGVEAPRSIGVYRAELYERILRENEQALRSAGAIDDIRIPEKHHGV